MALAKYEACASVEASSKTVLAIAAMTSSLLLGLDVARSVEAANNLKCFFMAKHPFGVAQIVRLCIELCSPLVCKRLIAGVCEALAIIDRFCMVQDAR